MCDCKGQVKEEIKKSFADRNPEMVYFDHETMRTPSKILLPVTILYKHTTKKGVEQDKKMHITVSPQFCPFCGQAYEEG